MRCRSPLRRQRAAMSLALTAGVLSVLISGCASLANTPEQDLAWSRWTACRTQVPGADIRRVQTDGRIFFWFSGPGDAQAMVACLQQAGKDGPALPDPAPEPRSGGGGGGGGGM
jgi:hypothetical protein